MILSATVLQGDCRLVMPAAGLVDVVIADPPYGDTSLGWDKRVDGWLDLVRATLKPHGSLWCFGSMRFFLDTAPAFDRAGFRYAQDIVWRKHNGSGFHADRFRRVHEHVVHWCPKNVQWGDIYKSPVKSLDAVKRTVTRRNRRASHWGKIADAPYVSEDGGPRLVTSVLEVRSCHGYAEHPTQKPIGILAPLIEFSCPPGGTVGDWFAGSGAVGVAAVQAGRGYIGCELNPFYFDIAERRIQEALGGRGDLQ